MRSFFILKKAVERLVAVLFVNYFGNGLYLASFLLSSLPSPFCHLAFETLCPIPISMVACEGLDRVEQHERLTQWRTGLESSGFAPAHLGSNAFKQASMLLALFADGDGYRVEENNGCLMLGWHTRPLIATSAWQLAGKRP